MSRVPKMESHNTSNTQPILVQQNAQSIAGSGQMPSSKDEDKMPLFLIKLWNIVEDPTYQQIIKWDESGYSFHITDPYSFGRNILPHYFKHNNINSFIRQLNMYGFRKMTPLDRGGLTRSESDQDHLEFSHPYFVRDQPDLLVNIKRKVSGRAAPTGGLGLPAATAPTGGRQVMETGTIQSQSNLQAVLDELRTIREHQRNMDIKMNELTKENETLWEQMALSRSHNSRQHQVITKLVQFLVAMVQPNLSKRVLKRGVLAIDEVPTKRSRTNSQGSSSVNNLTDILDRLQRELIDNGGLAMRNGSGSNSNSRGPIIAEVTDDNGSPLNDNGQYSPPPYVPSPSQRQNQRNGTIQQPSTSTAQPTSPYRNSQQPVVVSTPPQNNRAFSPTIQMSPSLDRQISQELQEYLNGVDIGIENCRDLLGSGQWDFDFPEMLDDLNDPLATPGAGNMYPSGQLALEQGPSDHMAGQLTYDPHMDHLDMNGHDIGAEMDLRTSNTPPMHQQQHMQMPDHQNDMLLGSPMFGNPSMHPGLDDNYPATPELLTPCASPGAHH